MPEMPSLCFAHMHKPHFDNREALRRNYDRVKAIHAETQISTSLWPENDALGVWRHLWYFPETLLVIVHWAFYLWPTSFQEGSEILLQVCVTPPPPTCKCPLKCSETEVAKNST